MSGRQPDEYYIQLERRLRALEPLAKSVLPPEPYSWFMDHLDAGEYGLAVEVASEEMSQDDRDGTHGFARGLLREAELMGLPDAVVQRLML